MFLFFDFNNKIQYIIYNHQKCLKFFTLLNPTLLIIQYSILINFQIFYFLFYLIFNPLKILCIP